MLDSSSEADSAQHGCNRKRKDRPPRRRQQQRPALDSDAFLQSAEKPYWMLRKKRDGGEEGHDQRNIDLIAQDFPTDETIPFVSSPKFGITTNELLLSNLGHSPRGYDPYAPIFVASVEFHKAGRKVRSAAIVAKKDLSLQQLKGTLRVQLSLSWNNVMDAELRMFKTVRGSISEVLIREDNAEKVLRYLGFNRGQSCIRVYI
jgi:hypothetical protein